MLRGNTISVLGHCATLCLKLAHFISMASMIILILLLLWFQKTNRSTLLVSLPRMYMKNTRAKNLYGWVY